VESNFNTQRYDTGWIPDRINSGPWFTSYSWPALEELVQRTPIVLPVCSLGTPASAVAELGDLILPPLFHEAMDAPLKQAILGRVDVCFPYMRGSSKRTLFHGAVRVIELPARRPARIETPPRVLCVQVDTAVEEHGPHLPLATDRIQCMTTLRAATEGIANVAIAPPADYGQLAWALPIGLSIDLTAPLTARYVEGYVNALVDWLAPSSIYVACTHGSKLHHQAIQTGLAASRAKRSMFRWLLEPLGDFTGARGDAHAGGVETAMIRHINPALVDGRWWPGRVDELARGQITLAAALEGAKDVDAWVRETEARPWNGIVGDVRNFFAVDAREMLGRMAELARRDIEALAAQSSATEPSVSTSSAP